MAFFVDRVVICDAYKEPDRYYELLPGAKSKLVEGKRRPSQRYIVGSNGARKGIRAVVGNEPTLDDAAFSNAEPNEFVNQLRDEVREWRKQGYPATAIVTRRLLEWWFERNEERAVMGTRFFFCQQEAIETVIYLYEVKQRYKFADTGNLVRYALKLATGTGKTVVMGLIVTWATLHKRKVAGSPLSTNFLVLVPNRTVRDRVSGIPRGDGLEPGGAQAVYTAFEMVPPEYEAEFQPNVKVRNWQSIQLESKRDDWLPEDILDEGRFIPAAVLKALRRRSQRDPNGAIQRVLGNWRDVIVINDEAHHAYGEKRSARGEDPGYIKWNKILDRVAKVTKVSLIADLSATPWYGSGSKKPTGTLFEWLVSDFSVYDAFESGLVKVVRLPDAMEHGGAQYINLWDSVRGANTKTEYLSACKGAIANIYASWAKDFKEWSSMFEELRTTPCPVLLCVTDNKTRATWLYEHLVKEYEFLRNPEDEDPRSQHTIQVDTGVFDADKGKEAVLRDMVSTVGKKGASGEHVRCVVSVNMLSEGWDVKSVSHILGLRAFGSPLLTEQIIGRGLRRVNYDILNQPLEERPEGCDETVDAFGIPFVGFPVQKKKRPKTGKWDNKPVWIEVSTKRDRFRIQVPNIRSWAVGITQPLSQLVKVDKLPAIHANPVPQVTVKPVVGGKPEAVLTLDEFRDEWPLLRTSFLLAQELYDATNPGAAAEFNYGPTFDELLEITTAYVNRRVTHPPDGDHRDIGIYNWRHQALNVLENAVRGKETGASPVPIPGKPETLDSANIRRFQWTGVIAEAKRSHTTRVPCHNDLEKQFVEFLDSAKDVVRFIKNERFGFSVTYYENHRPRQFFPDFIVVTLGETGNEEMWLAETKGEIHKNTNLKNTAAEQWCEKVTATKKYGVWRYVFAQQVKLQKALGAKVQSFAHLAKLLS